MARRRPDAGNDPSGSDDEPALSWRHTGQGASSGVDVFAPAGDEPALAWAGRADLPTFSSHYRARRAEVTRAQMSRALVLAILAGGPAAIATAFFAAFSGGGTLFFVLAVVVFAPLVEEFAKAGGALYLVERHPWLVPGAWVLPLITLSAGLVFAVIENILYLNVYIEDPSTAIVTWRWIAGPLLHGGAALISGFGVARMWRAVDGGTGLPDIRVAAPWLLAAMIVHGVYNGAAIVLELGGWLPT